MLIKGIQMRNKKKYSFVDDMIMDIDIPKVSTKTLSKFARVAGFKINIQKLFFCILAINAYTPKFKILYLSLLKRLNT